MEMGKKGVTFNCVSPGMIGDWPHPNEGTWIGLGAGGDERHYACICTNTTPQGVRNWTYNDHGSPLYITENPNLTVTDPFQADGIRPESLAPSTPSATYLLTGQRISRPQRKGLYIRQGRLFLKD